LLLKATNDPGIMPILDNGLLQPGLQAFSWQVAEIASVPHLIVRFPLYDFSGIRNQSLSPVGSVVAWQNVAQESENFTNSLKTNIFYGLFGFVLTEFLLYFGIHLGAKKLENLVAQGRLELAHSLEKLQKSEEKFEAMAEYSVDWDAWHGIDGKYLYITPSCKEISGYSREVFSQDSDFFISIIHPDDREQFLDHRKQHHQGASEPAEITFRILRKDGEMRWIWHKCQAMFAGDGTWQGRRTTNRDVTALKEAEEKLQRLSTTDPLTGAYNRRMFMDMLSREMTRSGRYGEPFSLLMFDLDHFKRVNDTYGHDVGDRVLVEIVELSMELIRQSDILARWGGEEFMVLLPQTNPDMALALGERLRQRISEYRFTDAGRLTVSIGVAHQQQLDTIDSLLKRVDTAMYRAKETGRNRVVTG
ncbi:MAG: sensor domain-containing diguanylate cyclase, partial [Desulfobulbaceae bacterium]|nr:sensor domain-containing diguanylate cyclase [Desulfobulbaceae bacterium]